MRSKKSFLILTVILFSFILSFSGTSISVSNQNTVQNPGLFVSEVASLNPGTLDPATATNNQALGLIQLMYDGLFQYMNNSLTELAPSLATNYKVSSNGLVYTFTIRKGVQFTLQEGEITGQPLNAYVLQYSIDRAIVMNAHDGPAKTIDQWIKGAQSVGNTQDLNVSQAITFLNQQSVKALSATQLQITLSKPYGGFLQSLMQPVADAVSPKAIIDNKPYNYTTKQDNTFGMVSLASFFPGMNNKTILQNLGLPSTYNIDNSGVVPQSDPTGPAAYTWLTGHSAGTGPYYIFNLIQGQNADIAKNNNWWNRGNFQDNTPHKIQITQVADTTARINELKNGTIDQGDIPLSNLSEFGVTGNHTASTFSGVSSYLYPNNTNVFIGMNMKNTLLTNQLIEDSASNYNYGTHNVSRLFKYSWNNTTGNPQMAGPGNPFSALLFREAFAYAFPTEAFINQALLGFGSPMQGVIPKGILGHDSSLIADGNIPAYNSSKAEALFNEVGWKGTILMPYDSNSNLGKVSATLLAQSINSLYVNITIKPTPIAKTEWNPSSGQYTIFQSSYAAPVSDPSFYANSFYGNGAFARAINYVNPNVNNLINTGTASLSPYNRTSIYNQMEVNATGDYPYIYISQQKNVLLLRSSIQGVDNPASDSLNPMLYFLPLQYLAKGAPGAYNPTSTGCGFGFGCGFDSTSAMPFQPLLDYLIIIVCLGICIGLAYMILKERGRVNSKKKLFKPYNNPNNRMQNNFSCPKCNAMVKPGDAFCQECGMILK